MKFPNPIPVQELAEKIGATIIGDDQLMAIGINELQKVEKGDVTFVDLDKYYNKSLNSAASIIIIDKEVECPPAKALLIHDKPFKVYDSLVKEFRPFEPINQSISEQAKIDPSAIIEPGAIIAPNVVIGKNCYIRSNVVVAEHSIIGDNVMVDCGTVIGTDAFYFKRHTYGYEKWRSGGRVIIEDNVSIGSNCTINKGVSGDTVIGMGTKMDCQVHIGHGVVIGKNCLLAGQVGIGGKTIIEDWVTLYGQVGVAQKIRIGAKAIILAKSGVSKSLAGGKTYFGIPAEEVRSKYKELAALRHLPVFFNEYYK